MLLTPALMRAEDRLLIAAEPDRIETLVRVGDVQLETGAAAPLETDEVGMVEVAGPVGAYATLAALVLLASLLSQGLDPFRKARGRSARLG